jgi:hypothetical protein
MPKNWMKRLVTVTLLFPSIVLAQRNCTNGVQVFGTVTDPTGAVIPGAEVYVGAETGIADAIGHYVLPCVPQSSFIVTARANGFAQTSAQGRGQLGSTTHVDFHLAVAAVQTDVEVHEDSTALDADHGMGTRNLNTDQIRQLADDPDDFLRELQTLASATGGNPMSAMIRVDGFQNGAVLPPKSSIASVRVAPDLFSAEYQFPPFDGAQIEISTKPGADRFHGALFFTDSDSVFNANDPLSVAATPAGKQRYGFELTGPITSRGTSFAIALEKRDIDEFNVVNAVTLDSNGSLTPVQQSVSAPQLLWIGSARTDWQVRQNDIAALSFSANVNNLSNQGIGGLSLAESGYSSLVGQYDLRFSNTQTLSSNALHVTRIGYTWKRTEQTPLSLQPSLQVAGYFTGGGSTGGSLNNRERDLEVDDDLTFTHGRHELKIGVQSLGLFIHDYNPNTFNGAYVFGGGSAPVLDASNNPTGQTETITPIEQYQRALLNLPGGSPTTYQVTTGTLLVPLTQWRVGMYLQDNVKLAPRLTFSAGLRYALQTTPGSYANFGPRIGFGWAADKKETWVFHLRAGLFSSPVNELDVYRLNGIRQRETTIYSPEYDSPLRPIAGSVQVSTVNQFPPSSLGQTSTFGSYFSVEREFPHRWHAQGNIYWGQDYNRIRIQNINAPKIASSVGIAADPNTALLAPRPIAPNENILQYQNSGHLGGDAISFSLDQNSYKRFGLSIWYAHMHFKSDGGTGANSPQSSYTDQGESARADWLSSDSAGVVGNLNLPYGVQLSGQFDASAGHPYNVTTGTDNNGDGDFNDRPAYASAPGQGVYVTRFGLLTVNTVNGNVPRNLGTMPATAHLDMNIRRTFLLNPKDKDHPLNVEFNARSANLLNHTNVTTVNTVLSSSALGQPVAAETARRVELGLRFAF